MDPESTSVAMNEAAMRLEGGMVKNYSTVEYFYYSILKTIGGSGIIFHFIHQNDIISKIK